MANKLAVMADSASDYCGSAYRPPRSRRGRMAMRYRASELVENFKDDAIWELMQFGDAI